MATTSHSLPTHISTQETPNAGKCLFTSKDIAPGELVFQIGRPLVLVLDASRLKETCEGCLQWETGGHVGSREGDDGRGTQCGRAGEDSKRLKDCMGCKVVRYCGKVSVFVFEPLHVEVTVSALGMDSHDLFTIFTFKLS